MRELYHRAERGLLELRFEMKIIYLVRCGVALTLSASSPMARLSVADENPRSFAIRTASKLIMCADLRYEARRRVSFYKPGGVEIDGKRYVHILMKVSDEKIAHGFKVNYPFGVTERMVVPLFGYVCEIGEIRTDRRPGDGDDGEDSDDTERVQLVVSVVEDLREEFHPNQLAIPLGGSAVRHQNPPGMTNAPWQDSRYQIQLTSIKTVGKKAVAELRTIAFDRNKEGGDRKTRPDGIKHLVVREGETLDSPESLSIDKVGNKETLVPPTKFLVTRIVPPNPKRNIIGWITLRPLVKEWPEPPKENRK